MKNNLEKISNTLKLNNTKELNESLIREFEKQNKKIKAMQMIDTAGIEPMVRIDDTETSFLREDIIGDVLHKKTILENSFSSKEGFVIIKKVVK